MDTRWVDQGCNRMSKAQEVLNILDTALRVFEQGALRFEVQKVDGKIDCKVEYKNMAYRGQVGYDDSKGGVFWKFEPDFYPEEADEDDFLDVVFAVLSEMK